MTDTPADVKDVPPNQDPVQVLTEWLEMAQCGHLKAVAIAGITAGPVETTITTFTHNPPVSLIASVEIMAFRLKTFALLAQQAFTNEPKN